MLLYIFYTAAVGEPPLCMSSSVLYAMKRAIESARHDAGNDTPFTLCKLEPYNKVVLIIFDCYCSCSGYC